MSRVSIKSRLMPCQRAFIAFYHELKCVPVVQTAIEPRFIVIVKVFFRKQKEWCHLSIDPEKCLFLISTDINSTINISISTYFSFKCLCTSLFFLIKTAKNKFRIGSVLLELVCELKSNK